MKKYPFSKKAASIMIATALVVTPLANVFPVGGTTVVNAATVTLTAEQKAEIIQLLESIAPVFYATTRTELEADLTKIKTDEGEKIKAVLGGTTFDQLMSFYVALDATTKNKLTGLTQEDIGKLNMDTFIKETIQETVAGNSTAEIVQNNIKTSTGFTFEDIFEMKSRLDTELGLSDFEKGALKESLALAAFLSKNDTVTAGDEMTELVSRLGNVFDRLGDHSKKLIREKRTVLVTTPSSVDWNFVLFNERTTVIEPPPVVAPPGVTPPPEVTPPPSEPAPGKVILPEDAKKVETVQRADGRSSQVVTVDAGKLAEAIKAEEKLDRVTVVVETAAGEVVEVRVPAQAFTAISEKNPNAKVEVASKEGAYRLPVKEVNLEKIAKDLGVAAGSDVSISIQVSETEDTSGAVAKGKLTPVAKIVEFKVVASSGDKAVEMKRFSSFVEREIVGDKNFDAKKTTAVQLMDDGSFRAVPTLFDGNRAIFKSLTNSKYTVVENDKTFNDLEPVKDWAKEEIEKLASKYIINGFNETEFRPMGDTTRGQLAALLARALGLTTDAAYENQFTDVKATHTFASELTAAVEAGVIQGYTDGTFRPEETVTREQAAAMIARALRHVGFDESKLTDKKITYFVDNSKINNRFKTDVELLLQAGIMVGGTDQNLRPENINNRAQTAKVFDNFLKFINFIN